MGVWVFDDDRLLALAPDERDELPLAALQGRAVYSFERGFLPDFYDELDVRLRRRGGRAALGAAARERRVVLRPGHREDGTAVLGQGDAVRPR